jgi:acetylornithine/succinyldiaminopimelate/putrescine aminotransferase
LHRNYAPIIISDFKTLAGNTFDMAIPRAAQTQRRTRIQEEKEEVILEAALSGLPLFDGIRGEGLVAGIALKPSDHPWLSFEHFGMEDLSGHPSVGLLLCHRLYKRGFFCFVCGHDWSVLRLQPRFNIEPEKLEEFTAIVREELEHLCALA